MTNRIFLPAALMSLAISVPAHAQQTANASANDGGTAASSSDGVWRISLGANFTRGDYGDPEDTSVLSVPLTLRYSNGPVNLRVSVPFIRLDGPGSLIDIGVDDGSGSNSGSGGSGSNSGSGSGVDLNDDGVDNGVTSGIGDVTVAATYGIELAPTTFIDTTARIKIPTASRARRLGTGQVDVTLGADLVQEVGHATLYAGARRRFIGNSATTAYRDVWGAGTGFSLRASPTVSFGADLDWQQSAVPTNGDSADVTAWTSVRIANPLRLYLFAGTGLTTNSPDFMGGATLTYRF